MPSKQVAGAIFSGIALTLFIFWVRHILDFHQTIFQGRIYPFVFFVLTGGIGFYAAVYIALPILEEREPEFGKLFLITKKWQFCALATLSHALSFCLLTRT